MDRETFWVILAAVATLLAVGAVGICIGMAEQSAAQNWCQPRGYASFAVKGRLLCVDPKTRIVYLPER